MPKRFCPLSVGLAILACCAAFFLFSSKASAQNRVRDAEHTSAGNSGREIHGTVRALSSDPHFEVEAAGTTVPGSGDMRAGDLDLDGKADLVFFDPAQRSWRALLSKRGDHLLQQWSELPPGPEVDTWLLMDINGDKRSALAAKTVDGAWWLAATEPGGSPGTALPWGREIPVHRGAPAVTGDFNGDGCGDILTIDQNEKIAVQGISDCRGKFEFSEWAKLPFESPLQAIVFDPQADRSDDVHLLAGGKTTYLLLAKGLQPVYEQTKYLDPTLPPHDLSFQARGDLNGDSTDDILLFNRASNTWVASFFPGNVMREWSSVPPMADFSFLSAGDFNGDGLVDTIARAADGRSWSIGLSDGSTGIEMEARGALPPASRWNGVATADFDGDGAEDIAVWEGGSGKIWFLYSRISYGLPGVQVWPEVDVQAVRTLEDGTFKLKDIDDGRYISAWAPGYEFGPRFRKVSPTLRHNVSFTAFPQRNPPYVCVGFNPEIRKRWGSIADACPKHHAFYALQDPGGDGSSETAYVEGTCCRLPAEDILTEEETFVADECPPDFVATGGKGTLGCKTCRQQMKCTRINTLRYQLGPPNSGTYWGVGYSRVQEKHRLSKDELPVAIRHGVGRLMRLWWDEDGCIGSPWASLAVRKSGRRCSDLFFSELQYRGAQGDPPRGTPVKMYPDCNSITGISDPRADCVKEIRVGR